jgi:hypothetical protein
MFIYKIKNLKFQKGVAALITVLSLGGLIFTISMASAIISFWANQNLKSIRDSNKAFYAAQSGIQDSLIKLERNKDNFPANSTSTFSLSINGTGDVTVSIYPVNNVITITSTSTSGFVNKNIQAVINIDTTTGLVTPTSTVEQTL